MRTRSLEAAVQRPLTARAMFDQIIRMWRFSESVVLLIGLSLLTTSCQTDVEVSRSPQPASDPTTAPAAQSPTSVPPLATPKTEQTVSRRTVADYFLAIPSLGLGSGISPAERQELLNQAQQGQNGSVYDPNNGYLKVIRPPA